MTSLPNKPKTLITLDVPYFAQLDSATREGYKMCFSSSCAMTAEFLMPGSLKRRNRQPDDVYLDIVNKHGGTTNPAAHVKALRFLGIKATFRTDGRIGHLVAQLRKGIPIPVGWLHHGHVSAPSGGGHWTVVRGWDEAEARFQHNDPNGDPDLIRGGYVTTALGSGKGLWFSEKNWGQRWMAGPDGRFLPGSGWWLEIHR